MSTPGGVSTPGAAALRERVAEPIATVSDGEVSTADVPASGGSPTAAGVGSPTYLRLIDALESEFEAVFDLDDDLGFVEHLDSPVVHLGGHGVVVGDG